MNCAKLAAAFLGVATLPVGGPRSPAAQSPELMDGRKVGLLRAVAPEEFMLLQIPLSHRTT